MPRAQSIFGRWKNILLAMLALCMMIALPTAASYVVVIGAMFFTGFVHGGLSDAVVNGLNEFMSEHVNLYSAAVYVVFGIPVFAWVWGMRRRARARVRKVRAVQVAENQQLEDGLAEGVSSENASAVASESSEIVPPITTPFAGASADDMSSTGAPAAAVSLASESSVAEEPRSGAPVVTEPPTDASAAGEAPRVHGTSVVPAVDGDPAGPSNVHEFRAVGEAPAAERHIYYEGKPVAWQLAGREERAQAAPAAGQEHRAQAASPAEPAVQAADEDGGEATPVVSLRIKGVARRYYVAAVLMGYGMQVVTTLIMVLVEILLPTVMEEYTSLVEDSGITTYGFMWVISTLVLPPLVEETGFRGLGLTYLKRAGVPFAVANLVQALAFGIFHMNLTQGIYTFVLGLVLGYVAHRSGSLAPAMLLHCTYNLMGTLGTGLIYDYLPGPFFFLLITNAAALFCAFKLIATPPKTSPEPTPC